MRASGASEPRERSAPAQRRARERVGESEGRSPSEHHVVCRATCCVMKSRINLTFAGDIVRVGGMLYVVQKP